MTAEAFLRQLRVADLSAKVVVNTGHPYYGKKHVAAVRTLADGTISITLGKWAEDHS